jgi:molybdopterin-guanine dinucleotide biosynthesis protein B
MKAAQVIGWSGSGKTTLIVALIGRFRARGLTVGALKHTHHVLPENDRGDTALFRQAGAEPVILAGDENALVNGHLCEYSHPEELLRFFENVDVVFIEGFKELVLGTRIEVTDSARQEARDVEADLDRIWLAT